MLSLKWGNNVVGVTKSSTIRVTEQLIDSHLHMVKGAMRSTRQPMIIWVSDFDLEGFKGNPEVSKEFCDRINEAGNISARGFNFLAYHDRHFALSMSMQALKVDGSTIFRVGQGLCWTEVVVGGDTKLAIQAYPEEESNPSSGELMETPLLL